MKILDNYLNNINNYLILETVKWLFGSKISTSDIQFVEKKFKVIFPKTFKSIILKYNEGSPKPQEINKNMVVNSLISFKRGDKNNVITVYGWIKHRIKNRIIIPFAGDPFGNYFCFEYSNYNDKNPKIVFFDHEEWGEKQFSPVSNSFEEFLKMLH